MEGGLNRKTPWAAFAVVLVANLVTRVIFHTTGLPFAGPASTVTSVLAIWLLWRGGLLETGFVGLAWPNSKKKSALIFVSAFAVVFFGGVVLQPYLDTIFPSVVEGSGLNFIQGKPLLFASVLVLIGWIAAAFGEEVLFRGFLMRFIEQVLGGTRTAIVTAVLLQALIFGLLHDFPVGALVAGFIGVGFGVLYYLGGRKLWPLIIAHAIPDTISIISIYSGN